MRSARHLILCNVVLLVLCGTLAGINYRLQGQVRHSLTSQVRVLSTAEDSLRALEGWKAAAEMWAVVWATHCQRRS